MLLIGVVEVDLEADSFQRQIIPTPRFPLKMGDLIDLVLSMMMLESVRIKKEKLSLNLKENRKKCQNSNPTRNQMRFLYKLSIKNLQMP